MLEGADQAEVVRGEAGGRVDEAVVEEGVRAGVFHEGFELAATHSTHASLALHGIRKKEEISE
jgi:hypothetical protein